MISYLLNWLRLWDLWVVFGFFAQFLFFLRFFVQWVHSERRGRSVIPIYFWYFSIAGGIAIVIYSVHVGDPVFIVGQSLALLIYVRNLILVRNEEKSSGFPKPPAPPLQKEESHTVV